MQTRSPCSLTVPMRTTSNPSPPLRAENSSPSYVRDPLIHTAVAVALTAERPIRTVSRLAYLCKCGRTTLWRHWCHSEIPAGLGLNEFLDEVLAARVNFLRRRGMSCTSAARLCGVDARTAKRVVTWHSSLALRNFCAVVKCTCGCDSCCAEAIKGPDLSGQPNKLAPCWAPKGANTAAAPPNQPGALMKHPCACGCGDHGTPFLCGGGLAKDLSRRAPAQPPLPA